MVALLKRSASGTSNFEYLIRYATIGAAAVAVDVTVFQALVMSRVFLPLTTTIAFFLAALVHFALNKAWTFRVRKVTNTRQVATYLAVLLTSFIVTQVVIEASVFLLHLVPVEAKVLAIFVQLPVSFFGHRYFTFRDGREPSA